MKGDKGYSDHNAKWLKLKRKQPEPEEEDEEEEGEDDEEDGLGEQALLLWGEGGRGPAWHACHCGVAGTMCCDVRLRCAAVLRAAALHTRVTHIALALTTHRL